MAEQTRCIHGVEMDADGAHFDGCAKCAGADFGASDTPTPPQAEKLSDRLRAHLCCHDAQCRCETLVAEVSALEADRDALLRSLKEVLPLVSDDEIGRLTVRQIGSRIRRAHKAIREAEHHE